MSLSLNLMNPRNNEYDVSVMASSSSSSPRNSNKHGIFLSFRGEDTRDNFTSHLYSALCHNNIETFIDNDLKRGDEISQSLLDTIEASTISIIIFSERYASSGWCLDELLKILECKHVYGQIVIPVFCRVDPSHVRWQTGTFGDYFSKLGERFPKKMQRWRSALTEAANLSGFDSHVIRPESKLVEEIANEILERLDDTFQSYNKDLVGVEWRIKEIESLLCTGSAGVYILGIWGIGGIGKTTIADAVFNKISRHFEGSRVIITTRDKQVLKNCWASQIYQMKELVYTDAQKLFSQYAFRGGHLDASYTEVTYKAIKYAHGVPLALKVLGRHLCERSKEEWESAMRKLEIIPHMEIQEGTEAIKGISLDMSKINSEIQINPYTFSKMTELRVLKFYGSKNKCMVHSLEGVPFTELRYFEWHQFPLKTLNILHWENLVSLKMPGSKVTQLWDDVQNLVSLKRIDLKYSKLLTKLPDLSLARNLEILDLGYCSSLTETHSSIQYLNKLEVLDLDRCESLTSLPTSIHSKYLKRLVLRGCSNLKNLPKMTSCHLRRTLPLLGVGIEELPSSIECLSNIGELLIYNCKRLENISSSIFKLQFLESIRIHRCPNLQFLEIPSCNIDGTRSKEQPSSELKLKKCPRPESLPSGQCMFKSLTSLEIIDCPNFERLPDELGNLQALNRLIIDGTAIRELSEGLGQLALLSKLELKNCSELEYISSSIFKLKSVESIEISNCSNLKGFPEIPFCNIDGSGIERIPSSVLKLNKCSKLESLPSSLCMFKSLTSLEIIDCKKLERLPDELGNLEALEELRVEGTGIREVPKSLAQLALSKLKLKKCSSFESLPSRLIPEYLRSFPTSIPSEFTSLRLSVDLRNCLKLDPNELSEIIKDGWMKQSYVEHNDVILLVIIPSAQAPEIASSQVVRIAKEFYRDGPPKAALSEFESSLAERESLKSILTGDPNSRLQRKSKIFRDELVQLVGLIVQSSEDKRSFALQLSCQFEGKFYNTLQLTATGAAGRASCAPHEAAGTARDRERDCAAALASCAPPEAAVGTACDRDCDCAAARASCTPPEADGTARDRRLSVVLLL
ncbi:hypothetical protein WN944_015389 [Citrus x changshan-huyou]|uniref:TIR domain-containing protein n=1 Tax=Citrus x changshan-huyou TaxID=2935761 RepID=A0AAP0QJK1_9ROSI